MEVGAAAAAAAGVHLAGYNRDNFFQNLHLSQARRFQKQQIVTSQADLFRADVEQAIGASTAAVDDAATMFSAENFERQGLSKLFRVPGVQRFTENLNGAGNREASPGRDAFPSMDSTDIETSDSLEKLIAQQVSNELLLLERLKGWEMKEEWDELATYTPYFLVWGLRNLLTSFGFFLLSHFYLDRGGKGGGRWEKDWKPYAFLGHLFYVILTLGLSVLCDRLMATSRTIFTVETFLYLAGQALSWYIVYRERDAQNSNHLSILVVYVSQLANATFAHTSENGLNLRVAWLWMGLVVLDDALQGTVDESAEPLTEFPEDFTLTYELAEALHRMTFQVPTLSLLCRGTLAPREISSLSIDPSVPNHDRLQIRWQQLSRIRRAARQLCQFGIGAVIAVWMSVVIYQAVPGWTKGAAPPQVRSLSAVDGAFPEACFFQCGQSNWCEA
eukprot:s546_g5.t1